MRGLMMDYPLTIPAIVRRAETLFTRPEDRRAVDPIAASRERRIADVSRPRAPAWRSALQELGVRPGDRVATLAWASQEHLEAYLAIPSIGAVLHTLNLRLHPDDLTYIVNDARRPRADRGREPAAAVREVPRRSRRIEHVIVIASTAGQRRR